jgi:hypothetical protein
MIGRPKERNKEKEEGLKTWCAGVAIHAENEALGLFSLRHTEESSKLICRYFFFFMCESRNTKIKEREKQREKQKWLMDVKETNPIGTEPSPHW